MARFLFATVPVVGHLSPGLPIARALVERGHTVVWYTGRQFRAAIEAIGAHFAPIMAGVDPADVSLGTRFPERARLNGLAGFKFDLKHLFLDAIPGQVADLRQILAAFPADALLGDTAFLGLGMLHELNGPPWATYGITAITLGSRDTAPFGLGLPPNATPLGRARNALVTALFERVLFGDVQAHLNQVRAGLGLERQNVSVLNTLSPYLYLQASTAAFEYPRSDLPPQVHFIGPLLPETPPDFAPPDWWSELRGSRPVVLVNQGTIATGAADLMLPALRALADEPVLVVATTGGATAEQLAELWTSASEAAAFAAEVRALVNAGLMGGHGPGFIIPAAWRTASAARAEAALPANLRVAPFIPFGALLPHVDVMVTNGGFGGVQFALTNGVPLVVAGTTEDKPEIAARVAWSGAGINLKTRQPAPGQIRAAVRTLLGDPRYRANAARIRDDYDRHAGPAEAALLLERLARTGYPVLRAEVSVSSTPLPA